MLYQQGLTELIHSSPSEQVAYLLVERASLLESSEAPDRLMSDGNTSALLEVEAQVLETAAPQVSAVTTPAKQKQMKQQTNRMSFILAQYFSWS